MGIAVAGRPWCLLTGTQFSPIYPETLWGDRHARVMAASTAESSRCSTPCDKKPSTGKPSWFGACVTAALEGSHEVAFTDALLTAIEPHVEKARRVREERRAKDAAAFAEMKRKHDEVHVDDGVVFGMPPAAMKEAEFRWDAAAFPLRETLCTALGIDNDKLHLLHEIYDDSVPKRDVLSGLLSADRRAAFHHAYDVWVRTVAAPMVAALTGTRRVHYSAFPCIRVVRPGEFSIGVHCDTAYGFSPFNINFWVPLVDGLSGTSTLYVESEPGREDWHAIGGGYGTATRFFGAQCLHFSLENATALTRVSLDFRLIPEELWLESHDQYTKVPGYYIACEAPCESKGGSAGGVWLRCEAVLPTPDHRVGFPFT